MTSLGVEYGCPYTLVGPDGTRVVFNDDADPDFVGILSPESSGLDSPDVREDAQDAIEADGGVHGDFYYGRRPVILQGTIIATGAEDRNAKVAKIKAAANAMRADATLAWKPVGGPNGGVELKLRRQQPVRFTKGFVKDFQLPMVAASAYIVSAETLASIVDNKFIVVPINPKHVAVDSEFIYWADDGANTIGRANIDGTEPDNEFITAPTDPNGVAVDSEFIYWADTGSGTIGRANIDGTEPDNEFITAPSSSIFGIDIDANFIYWCDLASSGTIGRANIDGTEPDNEFITAPGIPADVVVRSTFIYWADTEGNTIGRANIDGTEPDNAFITAPTDPNGVAVDSEFIYWADEGANTIGRANIDGTEPDNEFITAPTDPNGVAVDSEFIYWADEGANTIGRWRNKRINHGNAPAHPIVKIYGPGSTFKLENKTTGEFILLEGVELIEGDYFMIDFASHTIFKNGTEPAYHALVFASSTWWTLEPGENEIEGPPNFDIYWKDTYL